MKSLKVLTFILVMFFTKAEAQQYYPFPTDSAMWSVACGIFEIYPTPHHEYKTLRYFLNGDTIIDSITYSKLYEYYGSSEDIDTANSFIVGGLREDSSKHIYMFPFLSLETCIHCGIYAYPMEFMLYRFDMEVGDTVQIGSNYVSFPDFIVKNIDSILVDQHYRKRYELQPQISTGQNQYWIEGIGSSMGLFGPSCNPFEGDVELLCYKDSSTVYIPGGTCFLWTFVSVPENKNKKVFKIFPNPTSGKIVVKLQDFEGNSLLKANNFLGKKIFERTILPPTSKVKIDVSTWPSGLYVFSLYEKGVVVQAEKVLITR